MECTGPASELRSVDSLQFGAKSIGVVGSIAVLLNNILGPGIANFSGLYQQAGWLPPSLTILLCVVSSVASGDMLLAAMRAYPGNADFALRVEYGTLCRHYFGRRAAILCQCLFQLAMLCANISNIIQTAQVLDYFVASLYQNKSCALMFYPSFRAFCHVSDSDNPDVTPFGTGKVVLSMGMAMVTILSVPLGYWNLEDNIKVQNAALVVILLAILAWIGVFGELGLESERVPAIGSSLHNMGGTILFNFMFISTLPSWACEKKPSVKPLRTICVTLVLAVLGYISVGVLGGMAFEAFFQTDNTLLSELNLVSEQKSRGEAMRLVAFSSVQGYAIASNLASIPIFSILMRYNLIESGLIGPRAAGALAVLVPFTASVILYTGEGFKDVVNFAGTFTSAFVNLMVPSLLFLSALRMADAPAAPGSSFSATSCVLLGSYRRPWRAVAWANLTLMLALIVVSVADQYS